MLGKRVLRAINDPQVFTSAALDRWLQETAGTGLNERFGFDDGAFAAASR